MGLWARGMAPQCKRLPPPHINVVAQLILGTCSYFFGWLEISSVRRWAGLPYESAARDPPAKIL